MNAKLETYAAQLAALGHAARLAIVRALLRAHPDGRVAGDLQRELGIPASTLSHHLDALHRHQLVEQTREGKFLRYTVSERSLVAILRFLIDECCGCGVALDLMTAAKRAR